MNSGIQKFLLWRYARIRDTGILSTGPGRRLFEWSYLAYKSFEAGPVDRLATFVRPGTLVIDVGANIGFFTRRFARWVGADGGRVLAIEPEGRNVGRLTDLLRKQGVQERVEVLHSDTVPFDWDVVGQSLSETWRLRLRIGESGAATPTSFFSPNPRTDDSPPPIVRDSCTRRS